MKYIIFQLQKFSVESIRIFDEITNHSDVAREVASVSPGYEVASAGRVNFREDGSISVTNGSTSLHLDFNSTQSDDDVKLIRRFLRF